MSTLLNTETLPLRPMSAALTKRTPTKIEPVAPQEEKLTRKQKLAVEYFVSGKAKTQTAAARMAGYSESTAQQAGWTVFSKLAVKREVQRRRREIFEGIELESKDIVNEIRRLAEANLADYIELQDDGSFKINLNNCTREQLAVVQDLSYDAVGRPKISLADKKSCWETLGKLMGIGHEKNESNNMNAPLTIEGLDALLRDAKPNVTINNNINVSEDQFERMLPARPITKVIEQM